MAILTKPHVNILNEKCNAYNKKHSTKWLSKWHKESLQSNWTSFPFAKGYVFKNVVIKNHNGIDLDDDTQFYISYDACVQKKYLAEYIKIENTIKHE